MLFSFSILSTTTVGENILFKRDSGVLLHITSLPGKWGIGTLGAEAFQFADWLSSTGASVWQVLPVSPPVYANSPYQALSSFAGNPLLISPELLYKDGLLSQNELSSALKQNQSKVVWSDLSARSSLLKLAASRALKSNLEEFSNFSNLPWVKQWSLFSTMKQNNSGKAWINWNNISAPEEHDVLVNSMIQFFFQKQWDSLHKYCTDIGVRILGDIPIYTAHDSSDVYFNRKLFKLKIDGSPSCVAGVPPDYFSKTGQLWGNPVYDWDENASTDYLWWTSRLARALELYDSVRIDHFRGFDEYWEIPSGEKTAVNGTWQKGPGVSLFDSMKKKLGVIPVIAEDLGLITESVNRLREKCNFPGMTVLQFVLQAPGFSIKDISASNVIYTGTHDNDTTLGWIRSVGSKIGYDTIDSLISIALNSPACLAVIPMQDILKLGSSTRMNKPASTSGNWSWRMNNIPDVCCLLRNT